MNEPSRAVDTGWSDSDSTIQSHRPDSLPSPFVAEPSTREDQNGVAKSSVFGRASQDGDNHHCQTNESLKTLLQEEAATNASQSKNTATRSQSHPYHLLNWWRELAGCLLSIIAFVGMCITLAMYQRKPSPNWPVWLSLNTIVSIYSLVVKAGIVYVIGEGLGQLKWSWLSKDRFLIDLVRFDEASRGPSGALRLLWRLRTHHFTASCGALLAVLALAVDPIAQQMLRYYDCSVTLSTEQASVPRTNFFYDIDGMHIGAGLSSVSNGVQNSVLAGIFGSASSVDPHCPSGNCTWTEHYSTFGYCSKCEDISHLVSVRNFTDNSSYNGHAVETALPDGGIKIIYIETLDGATVPDAFAVPVAALGPAPYATTGTAVIDFLVAKPYLPHGLRYFEESLGLNCSNADNDSKWQCNVHGAARCHITPCVKTYAASMEGGKFSEVLLDTAGNWGWGMLSGDPQFAMLDTKCITQGERQSLERIGYNMATGERWLPYNLTTQFDCCNPSKSLNLSHQFPDSLIRRNCVYAFDYLLQNSLSNWFTFGNLLFNGTVSGNVEYGFLIDVFSGPQVPLTFYNYGDVGLDRVDALLKNATESLTRYMRQNGVAEYSAPAQGLVKQTKTCVEVRWLWLIFPTGLLILALLFFILLAVETRPGVNGPAIWKSSPLALLYHGLAGPAETKRNEEARADTQSIQGMEDSAKKTVVRLEDSGYHCDAHLEVKSEGERT